MIYRLGLDLGTNSIGWALLRYTDQDVFEAIQACGVRIIPMEATHRNEFENGQTITKNADRRLKRSARRLRQRYLLRRENLTKALRTVGVPIDLLQQPDTRGARAVYQARANAATSQVSLEELGRILYRINQRRGYKSNRKERAGGNSTTKKQIRKVAVSDRQPTGRTLRKKAEYYLCLSDGTEGTTTDKLLIEFPLNTPTEVEYRTTSPKKGEPYTEFAKPNPDDWHGQLALMEYEFDTAKMTPAAYFAREVARDPHYRIRRRFVMRSRYSEEYWKIWKEQLKHYPQLSDPRTYHEIIDQILPRHSPNRYFWRGKDLGTFIHDYIIFYQRPLKSKKSTVSDCPLERVNGSELDRSTGEVRKAKVARKVIHRSHPLYQEYRTWGAINNVRIEARDGVSRHLTNEEKETLYEAAQTKPKLLEKDVRKLLGIAKDLMVGMQEEIPGNQTFQKIKRAWAAGGAAADPLKDPDTLTAIWHLLLSVDDAAAVKRSLQKRYGLTEAQAELVDAVQFSPERGAYSARAIRKLLTVMRAGKYFDPSQVNQHARKRIATVGSADIPENLSKNLDRYGLSSTAISDYQGLPVYLALSIVYGRHQASITPEKYQHPEDIELVRRHSLRNPIVEQIINEMLQVVRDVWKQHHRPNYIRVELARELKASAAEREKRSKRMRERRKEREVTEEKLRKDFNRSAPTRKDKLRYELWEEQKHECPYTGKTIPQADLFNGNTDIDHIIPRQRYYDDSQRNKVLTFRKVNEDKSNLLATEYVRNQGKEAYDKYLTRIWKMYPGKYSSKRSLLLADEVPSDFTARQLQDTRYISRKAMQLLAPVAAVANGVGVSSGNMTNKLKNDWHLTEAFKRVQWDRFKRMQDLYPEQQWWQWRRVQGKGQVLDLKDWNKRIDHRHHALDAITVGLTTQSMIQRLTNLESRYRKQSSGKQAQRFERPHSQIEHLVTEALNNIIVSHKKNGRLLTSNRNFYRRRNPETGKLVWDIQTKGRTPVVRGQLHDEQPFGIVRQYDDKRLAIKRAFDDIDKLAVDWQRARVAERLAAYGGDANAAAKSLKKQPLVDPEGNELTEVVVWKNQFAKNRVISADLTEKQIREIPDKAVRTDITNIIAQHGGSPKEALTTDNLALINEQRAIPLFSARSFKSGDLKQLKRKGDPNEKLYVDPGNNWAFLIYTSLQDDSREYDVISFFDAVRLKQEQDELDFSRPGYQVQLLQKGDTIYIPRPGETVDASTWNQEPAALNKRLYKVTKFTKESYQFYGVPINYADSLILEYRSKSYKISTPNSLDEKPQVLKKVAIKVNVDRLGRLSPAR